MVFIKSAYCTSGILRPIEKYYWDVYVPNRFYNENILLSPIIIHFYTYLTVPCLCESPTTLNVHYILLLNLVFMPANTEYEGAHTTSVHN